MFDIEAHRTFNKPEQGYQTVESSPATCHE